MNKFLVACVLLYPLHPIRAEEPNQTKPEQTSFNVQTVQQHQQALYLNNWASQIYKHGEGETSQYAIALNAFGQAAEYGISNAQFYYARMHQYGHGCEQDFDKAWDWYQRAAQSGDRRAWNNLGYMLNNGQGRATNQTAALEYYLQASKEGMAMASYNIGHHYQYTDPESRNYQFANTFYLLTLSQYSNYPGAYNQLGLIHHKGGYGLEANINSAFDFYQKAQEQGDKYAPLNIGRIYRDGLIGPVDLKLAEVHFLESASRGCGSAWNYLGDLYWENTYNQQNRAKALAYYLKAREAQNLRYTHRVGWLYKSGPEHLQDEKKAFQFLTESAQLGQPRGVRSLGYCYAYGIGTPRNRAKAEELWLDCGGDSSLIQWEQLGILMCRENYDETPDFAKARYYFEKGTDENYPKRAECYRRLGYLYRDTTEDQRDHATAISFFEKAAELDDLTAHTILGDAYLYGKGTPKDFKAALRHYETAHKAGEISAINNLGHMYETGKGTKRNYERAAEIYTIGMQQGLEYSIHSLALLHLQSKINGADKEKGLALLIEAAEGGSEPAIRDLIAVHQGKKFNFPPNNAEALHWEKMLEE